MALPVRFDYRRGNIAIHDAAVLQSGVKGNGGGFIATQSGAILPAQGNAMANTPAKPKRYSDMQQLSAQLVTGIDNLILTRSDNLRVFLLIFNSSAVNIYYAFDQTANATCVPIPPNGNLFFDNAVPQNDLHLFYANGNPTQIIPIQYMVSPE